MGIGSDLTKVASGGNNIPNTSVISKNIESVSFDGNLTGEGQSLLSDITEQNPQKGAACGSGIYDLDTGLMADLETFQELVFQAKEDSVKLTSQDNGTTLVEVDEDGDGKVEQSAIYDEKTGQKLSETIDRNQDGNSDAVITYDLNGVITNISVDKDSDGNVDYEEGIGFINGEKINTVTEYWQEGDSEGIREREIQLTNDEITYMAKDNDGDGSWDYESGEYKTEKLYETNGSSILTNDKPKTIKEKLKSYINKQ